MRYGAKTMPKSLHLRAGAPGEPALHRADRRGIGGVKHHHQPEVEVVVPMGFHGVGRGQESEGCLNVDMNMGW